jgi:hypothetical protein
MKFSVIVKFRDTSGKLDTEKQRFNSKQEALDFASEEVKWEATQSCEVYAGRELVELLAGDFA